MGIFSKLFSKKEQNSSTKGPQENTEKLMDADKFWGIIATSKQKSSGDYEKQQEKLLKQLIKLPAMEILAFDNRYRTLKGQANTWDFWAAAYIINEGCSDDSFTDFRGWLIGQGRTIFENALADIESLATLKETNDGDWEGLCYVADDAYQEKTDEDMPNGITEKMETTGEEWNEEGDDLKIKYPQLWAKFATD